MFDGRCVDYSDDEIRRVINGPGDDKPYPMPNRVVVDYYFSTTLCASHLKRCETILAKAGVLDSSGALKQEVESTFDKARLSRMKSEFGDNYIVEAAALYFFRNLLRRASFA